MRPLGSDAARAERLTMLGAKLVEATSQLLSALGLEPPEISPKSGTFCINSPAYAARLARIDLNDGNAQGTLFVHASDDLLTATYPTDDDLIGADRDRYLRDWIGEIANQTLGRLKNLLLPYRVDFRLGTPQACEGATHILAAPNGSETLACETRVAAGSFAVVLAVRIDASIDWQRTEDEAAAAGSEVLF